MNAKLLLLLFSLTLAACGPVALRPVTSGDRVLIGGTTTRALHTLTDLEEVRAAVSRGGLTYIATDAGLLRYPALEAPGELVEGLPSGDVRGLVVDGESLLVATAEGLFSLDTSDEVTPVHGAPEVGHLMDLEVSSDGTTWVCGLQGVGRRAAGGAWEVFVEGEHCTDLAPTAEGQVWIGTTQGLWYVDGDIVREHPVSGGVPEGYVREIVPVLPGQIMAILQGPNETQIGHWDGERWYGYTLAGLDTPVVGLVRRGSDVVLVAENRLLTLAPRGAGVPLVPLSATEGTVRSFRPRIVPATEHQGQVEHTDARDASRLAAIPENRATVEAPPFVASPLPIELPGRLYAAFVHGPEAFLAVANSGVLQLSADGHSRVLRSMSLVPENELQLATDSAAHTWMLTRRGHLAQYTRGRLSRVEDPDGARPQALADGPQGAYLVSLDRSEPNRVHVFTNAGRGWTAFMTRTLDLPTPLIGVPFAGVAPDGKVWLALRVEREEGGERMRGAAVLDSEAEAIVYHHRGADRAAGGLPLPDEITALEFDTENAWFASFSGLVRLGSSQAVVFGETRGVRGEVVMDVAVGNGGLWLTTAEGLGSYDRSNFSFAHPDYVHAARPTRLATDLAGHLWAASPRGLLLNEGQTWRLLDREAGLSNPDLADVTVDEAGRVWLLADDRVMMLER